MSIEMGKTPEYPTGRERRPAGRNRLRYWTVAALLVVLAFLGTPRLATAATPSGLTYEVVTANSAGTWLAVQGPKTYDEAKTIRARLMQVKFNACRLHLPACGNTYTVYLIVKQ